MSKRAEMALPVYKMETQEPGAGKVEKNHGGGGQRKKESRALTEAAYPA